MMDGTVLHTENFVGIRALDKTTQPPRCFNVSGFQSKKPNSKNNSCSMPSTFANDG